MSKLHALFLVNAVFVALAALPLIFAYPAVFAQLGIQIGRASCRERV